MEISRKRLEKITTSLAIILLALMVLILTLVISNFTFKWDLFPAEVEKIGGVVIFASFLTIISSVVINIMLNIGRIADHFDSK